MDEGDEEVDQEVQEGDEAVDIKNQVQHHHHADWIERIDYFFEDFVCD